MQGPPEPELLCEVGGEVAGRRAFGHAPGPRSVGGRRENAAQCPQPEHIAVLAEPDDLPDDDVTQQRPAPKFFAFVNIGQMDLDHGEVHGKDRIADGHAGMRIRGRVDQNRVMPPASRLDRRNDLAFAVGLETLDSEPEITGESGQLAVDIRERGPSVDLGFTRAEQIEVRSVHYQNRGTLRRGLCHLFPIGHARAAAAAARVSERVRDLRHRELDALAATDPRIDDEREPVTSDLLVERKRMLDARSIDIARDLP